MSQQRFTQLYSEHEMALYRFIWSLLPDRNAADDVIQAAMAQLWEHFEEYDDSRPFLPWASRFAYRQVLMHRRRESRQRRFFSETTMELLSEDSPPNDDLEGARMAALNACMSQLTDRQRQLIRHRYEGTVPIAELAGNLGQTVSALYKSLERTRRSLADCVSNKLTMEGFHEL